MGWWPFSGRTQTRDIFWLGTARQELQNALPICTDAQIEAEQERVNGQLLRIFPQSRICVSNLYRGYNYHPDQFILQVETEDRNQKRTILAPHVVKIFFGNAREQLEQEGLAWENCWGSNSPSGRVLMRVNCKRNSQGRIYALLYEEAENCLCAPQVVTLEKAVINCVRHANPELTSVRQCITTLFSNLRIIHDRSREEPEGNRVASVFPTEPNLDRSLRLWSDFDLNLNDGNTCREQIRRSGSCTGSPFIDPVDYLAYVRDSLARKITTSERGVPLIPTTVTGWAHGDLHGKNILVGVTTDENTNEQVTLPAVFDYGKMGPNLPVVLDFVKLETELKIRALPAIFQNEFPQTRRPLMQEFEHVLNRWTRHCSQRSWLAPHELPSYWPPVHRNPDVLIPERTLRVPENAPALCRLLAILLDIRKMAAEVLQQRSSQPNNWFRQYLFWLAFYGLRTVRYTNLREYQLLSAFYSAGVAAAELQ